MSMSVEIEDLGTLLKVWRVMADLSLDAVAVRASEELPGSTTISRELVRRYEANQVSAVDVGVVMAITRAVGRRLSELPDEVLSDADLLHRLYDPRNRWLSEAA